MKQITFKLLFLTKDLALAQEEVQKWPVTLLDCYFLASSIRDLLKLKEDITKERDQLLSEVVKLRQSLTQATQQQQDTERAKNEADQSILQVCTDHHVVILGFMLNHSPLLQMIFIDQYATTCSFTSQTFSGVLTKESVVNHFYIFFYFQAMSFAKCIVMYQLLAQLPNTLNEAKVPLPESQFSLILDMWVFSAL